MGKDLVVRRNRLPQSATAQRAAQYVRMSTDYQRYSIENQAAVIATYAEVHQLAIVRTYRDEGVSGLKIKNRLGLVKLLDDVKSGHADFGHVLVYDVSRWGRFQDIDESAHHEFVCRQHGIHVVYCAEQFQNDGSLLSSIIKNIKRVMAAEYSRELSVKVHAGQCRIANLGYRVGGPLTFGLRRELVDENQRPKGLLKKGERKALQTDRVRLRLGTQKEADIIRRIFHQFVIEKKSDAEIARELNQAGVPYQNGATWSDSIIHGILKNESYVGNIVHNRTSRRLGQKLVNNPANLWIRREAAIDPIVDQSLFRRAQKIMAERYLSLTDDQMLVRLRVLLHRKGKLTFHMINNAPGLPSTASYVKHFGSLRNAYARIGYNSPRDCDWIDSRDFWSNTLTTHATRVANALRSGKDTKAIPIEVNGSRLTVGGTTQICFAIARQIAKRGPGHLPQWRMHKKPGLSGLLVVLRLGGRNKEIADYLLLPAPTIRGAYLHISDTSMITGALCVRTMAEVIASVKGHFERSPVRDVGYRQSTDMIRFKG